MKLADSRAAALLAATSLLFCAGVRAQQPAPLALAATPDYSIPAKPFPHIRDPYRSRPVPDAVLSNAAGDLLQVRDGKLHLSMAQVVAAVIQNSLTVAGARYYLAEAKTDLMRARSGASPRGVDQSSIPSGVFAGAVGGSILGTAGGGGGGASNAGGISGAASAVRVGPVGAFDPSLNVTFSVDRTSSPLNSLVVAGVPHVATNTISANFSYTQAFPTGTSFSASYNFQRQSSSQLHLLFYPDFTPGFTASVSQQLLNGFGTKVNRALIEVAQNEQGIERESFRQALITAIASAQNAYWDLISAQESLRTAQQAVDVSQQLYNNNQRAFEAGVMAKLDVVNAQSQLASSQRDLVIAQTNVQYAELTLKGMISENLDEPFVSAPIETADSFPDAETEQIPALDQATATARKNRPELAIAQGNIKSQQDALPFIRNSLEPRFNAFGLVNTVGLYNTFGTAFSNLVELKYPQWAVGLNYSFSVHNQQAQADDVRSRLELRQAQDSSLRAQTQTGIDVQTALIGMRQGKEQVRAAQEAVVLEQQKTDAEQKKLTAGLSTSYNVILVERDLFAAQLAETQARDAYAKSKVALDLAMGATLVNNHIDLDDAIQGVVNQGIVK